MKNIKDDKYYLEKIFLDVDFLLEQIKGKSCEEVEANMLLVDCIMFRLIQITENSAKLSNEFKEKYSYVQWAKMKGMRNRVVHGYDEEVDFRIIYDAITTFMPMIHEIAIKELKK